MWNAVDIAPILTYSTTSDSCSVLLPWPFEFKLRNARAMRSPRHSLGMGSKRRSDSFRPRRLRNEPCWASAFVQLWKHSRIEVQHQAPNSRTILGGYRPYLLRRQFTGAATLRRVQSGRLDCFRYPLFLPSALFAGVEVVRHSCCCPDYV